MSWFPNRAVPQELTPSEWRTIQRVVRVVVALVGLGSILVAHGLHTYDSRAFGHFPVWLIWPQFLVAGVLMIAWTFRSHSTRLAYWSGRLALTACLSRGIGTVLFYWYRELPLTWPNVELLIGEYVPAFAMLFLIWWIAVGPIARALADDADAG